MANWQKADIPLNGGLNLAVDPQAMVPGDFLQLDNVTFNVGAGVSPRAGHTSITVVSPKNTEPTPDTFTSWVYGAGLYNPTTLNAGGEVNGDSVQNLGRLEAVTSRDSELIAWDGFRSLSLDEASGKWYRHGEKDQGVGGPAPEFTMVTHANERNVLGLLDTSLRIDLAVGGVSTVYAWREGTKIYVTVEDNVTKATPYHRVDLYDGADPNNVRVTYSRKDNQLYGHFYVLISDSTATALRSYVIPEANVATGFNGTYFELSAAIGVTAPFDVRPVHDGKCGVLFETAGTLRYVVLRSNNTSESGVALDLGGADIQASSPVALAVHPDGGVMATWTSSGGGKKVRCAFYTSGGSTRLYDTTHVSVSPALTTEFRVACEFTYLKTGLGAYKACVAWTDTGVFPEETVVQRVEAGLNAGTSTRLGDTYLTHSAMRVGNSVFFGVGYTKSNTIQPMYVVVSADRGDQDNLLTAPRLFPVAASVRGTATISSASGRVLQSSACVPESTKAYPSSIDNHDWAYMGVGSRLMLTPSGTTRKDYQAVRVDLDFLPPLRTAQGGRSLYVAGGVVLEFDGTSFLPAGFLQIPEIAVAGSGTAGSMTDGTYTYRVYAEERNATGEWIRSAAISKTVTLSGQTSVTITFPPMPYVYRSKWRWNVYRGAVNSTLLKLVTQITPTYTTVRYASSTYNDGASDASIASNALDPAPAVTQSGIGLLDQTAPPSCTLVKAAKDRVWFAGGGIPHGQAAYSRLYDPGEAALWNEALVVQVDRTDKPITGFGLLQDSLVVFKDNLAYVITGDGPDNLGRGEFNPSQAFLTDVGCVSPDSVQTTPLGVAFQSAEGPRIVTPGGGLTNVGYKVDPAFSKDVLRITTVRDSSVRFHGPTDTYVLDYSDPQQLRWARWTYGASSAIKWKDTVAIVPSPLISTSVWVEDDAAVTDGGAEIRLAMDLGWLKTDTGAGWGRVKWWGLTGKYLSTHKLHMTCKYDYRDIAVDDHVWRPADFAGAETSTIDVTPLRANETDYSGLVLPFNFITSTDPKAYPGGPYVVCKSFQRQRTGTFRLFFEAVQTRTEDDSIANIKSAGSGLSVTGLTVAFQNSTENGRARWGKRHWSRN